MSPHSKQEYWSPTDWESAFKKDEARISAYMRELPRFVDLPNEDDIMLERILNVHKLELPVIDFDAILESEDEVSDIEEGASNSGDAFVRYMLHANAPVYQAIRKLSLSFNRAYAFDIPLKHASRAQAVMCKYGTCLARATDLLNDSCDDFPALRLAIAQRLHRYLHEMIRMLQAFPSIKESFNQLLQSHILQLQEVIADVNLLIYQTSQDPKSAGGYHDSSFE